MLNGEAVLTHGWKSPASACVPPTKSSAHNGLPVAMGDAGRKSGESTVCTSEALDSGEVSEDVARTSVKRVVLATTLVRCKTGAKCVAASQLQPHRRGISSLDWCGSCANGHRAGMPRKGRSERANQYGSGEIHWRQGGSFSIDSHFYIKWEKWLLAKVLKLKWQFIVFRNKHFGPHNYSYSRGI